MSATRAPLGLYIHWPYCRRICPYCDFNVYRARAYDTDLTDALIADLSGWAELAGARPLTSIHFGGGTPSLMSAPDVERVIDAAHRVFGLKSGAEIGLEANPAEADALPDLARAGINRMSVGVQSLRDDALKRLGRDHDAAKAAEAVRVAQKVVPRVSVDLIHTREGQSLADWEMELTEAIALGTGHVSAYQLTLEPGTAFARQAETGRLELPDGDAAADFQELTDQTLAAAGFTAYEISNHARTRQDRSVHNSLYWTGGDWIGIGPGAHSRLRAGRGAVGGRGPRKAGGVCFSRPRDRARQRGRGEADGARGICRARTDGIADLGRDRPRGPGGRYRPGPQQRPDRLSGAGQVDQRNAPSRRPDPAGQIAGGPDRRRAG